MRVYEHFKAWPPVGTGSLLPKKIRTTALAFVTVVACATSASAQSSPEPSYGAALQTQNPLTPLYSLLNENSTNFNVGLFDRTQNVLFVEPVIPVRLTPDFNLVTRWITPLVWQPELAPGIDEEFGFGNVTPQFFFTPAHEGDGFVWAVGANAWLPTATDDTLGINEWGGGPNGVALWINGPLLTGVLATQTWAGDQDDGSSVTGDRVSLLAVQPFVFYNFPNGWYVASLPQITADWTVPGDKWTVPIGGGIGRVFPVGDKIVSARLDGYYNGLFDEDVAGMPGLGDWTMKFTFHILLPTAKVPSLF